MQHANAPLTVQGRLRMVLLVQEEGLTLQQAAACCNVAKSTCWEWVGRWRAASEAERATLSCLEDRSSCPHRSSNQVSEQEAQRICERRRLPLWCYGWPCPGNLLHMDVKKLDRFKQPGHALTADRTLRSAGAGWEYVHSIIDDCSRLAYSEIHTDETAATVTAFTRRVLDWFLEQGIVCERLMTDNAFAYTQSKSLRQLLYRRAINHIRTRPYTPRTNGKVERFHQTLMREWAYGAIYRNSAERNAALAGWLDFYNHRRPHGALSHRPPIARLKQAEQPPRVLQLAQQTQRFPTPGGTGNLWTLVRLAT